MKTEEQALQERTDYMLNSTLTQLALWQACAKKALAALEWYASKDTWNKWPHADQGDRARIALKGDSALMRRIDRPGNDQFDAPEEGERWKS